MPDDQPLYMDISHHPLADATLDDIARLSVPQGRRSRPLRRPARAGAAIRERDALRRGQRHLGRGLRDLLVPARAGAVVHGHARRSRSSARPCSTRRCEFWLDWFRVFLDEVGDLVDVIMIGDDLAGQNGPLFRPDFYRRVVKPRQKRLVQYIRSRTQAKIWYHTCGACVEYIPDLLDNGIDILNPVQISAAGMDPAALEAPLRRAAGLLGRRRSTPSTSCRTATPEEVREHVRRNLEVWKPGGGYVFNNVHNIQAGVPPENVVAMYDAAYEFGFYGVSAAEA